MLSTIWLRSFEHAATWRRQLIADSAHELCTPVNLIQARIEMMEDDGPDIAVENRERVFLSLTSEPIDPESRNSGAAGLGLSICSEIARVHGGDIEAGSSKLIGAAKISLHLPKDIT